MDEIKDALNELETEEVLEETEQEEPGNIIPETIIRKHPLCIISKATYGEGDYIFHDIQSNSAWNANPYDDEYAVVPDSMVADILETGGFCDIVLNEDDTEIVSFTKREKPPIIEPEPEPTQLDVIEAQVAYTAMMTDTLLEV